jgi:large subunit ribosomal protein L31
VADGGVRDVREVGEDAAPVHAADDAHALVREAVVGGGVGRGVAPLVGRPVSQGDVADAHLHTVVEGLRHLERTAVLQAEEDGDLALVGGAADVLGALHVDHAGDQGFEREAVELLGMLPPAAGIEGGRHVEGPDEGVHPALAQARKVDVAVVEAPRQVGGLLPETGGDVGVTVQNEAVFVESHDRSSVAGKAGRQEFSAGQPLLCSEDPRELVNRSADQVGFRVPEAQRPLIYGGNFPERRITLVKPEIHPSLQMVTVVCACGNTFDTHSTKDELRLEICGACHPFFSGKQKLIDTAGRVERFQRRYNRA